MAQQPDASDKDLSAGLRVSLLETEDGLGVEAGRHRDVDAILARLVLALLWVVVGAALWSFGQSATTNPIVLPWTMVWAAAGIVLLWSLLWLLFGTEQVFVTGGALVLSKGIGRLRTRRIFPVDQVSNLRIRTTYREQGMSATKQPVSVISFEARGMRHEFGQKLGAEERTAVFRMMLRHLPDSAASKETREA